MKRYARQTNLERAVETVLTMFCLAYKRPRPIAEYRFHPTRKWRFDFAWPDYKIAVEAEGLAWRGGISRHTTPVGFDGDCDKYNSAATAGWLVLRFTAKQVRRQDYILDTVATAFALRDDNRVSEGA